MIRFRTEVYANIDMFDEVALQLLKMMGHSATVPGAIRAEDVPRALENLNSAVAREKAAVAVKPPPVASQEEDLTEVSVSLAHRAFPLIELLSAAARKNCNVMWKKI